MPLDLDAIEAQLDSSAPYYLPALIGELRAALAQVREAEERIKTLEEAALAARSNEPEIRCENCDQPIPDDGDRRTTDDDVTLCVDCYEGIWPGLAPAPTTGGDPS